MAKKESKPKKASKPKPVINEYSNHKYQKIIRAVGAKDAFTFDFADGTRAKVLKDDLHELGDALMDELIISRNGKHVSIPVAAYMKQVTWERIRLLSDPAFKRKFKNKGAVKPVNWQKFLTYHTAKMGINQQDFAALIGSGSGTVSPWFNGKGVPKMPMIIKILTVLNLTWSDLDNI